MFFLLSLFCFLANVSLYLFVIFPLPFFVIILGLILFLNNSFKTQLSKRYFLNCQGMDKIEINDPEIILKKAKYFPRLHPCKSVFKCQFQNLLCIRLPVFGEGRTAVVRRESFG